MELRHAHVPSDAPARRTLLTALVLFALCVAAVAIGAVGGGSYVSVLGALLLISGLAELIDATAAREMSRAIRVGFAGLIPSLMGVFLLFQLNLNRRIVAVALGLFFVVNALFRGIVAVIDRYPRWRWDLAYGCVGLILGILSFGIARRSAAHPVPVQWFAYFIAIELGARAVVIVERDLAFRRRSLPATA